MPKNLVLKSNTVSNPDIDLGEILKKKQVGKWTVFLSETPEGMWAIIADSLSETKIFYFKLERKPEVDEIYGSLSEMELDDLDMGDTYEN